MRTPPGDLDLESVALVLSERWNIEATSLDYVPLGFGSHHWIAASVDGKKWFLTADDLRAHHSGEDEETAFENLTTAFETAAALRDTAGLTWVVGPTATRAGDPIVRLTNQFSLAVFPYLDVEPTEFGEFRNLVDRNEAQRLVGRLHNATTTVPVEPLRHNTLAIPGRDGLHDALRSLDSTRKAGPYSEPARRLLREHAGTVRNKLRRFDGLAASVTGDTSGWVITHG
ncbi:MAG: phosphotransferase, partial [Chloroflexota bacterium]|nr:phosphotransferase [Chloroflexota bacterium]